MAKYEVTKHVSGTFKVRVDADNPDEAQALADELCSDADFGDLEDIDWENGSVAPV